MGKISVIIPVYNTEEYLLQCIQSLQNQTYSDLEIIVIDDGSTDSSVQIIEKIMEKDERIVLYRLHENKGVGYARNFGVQKATGDYIYFLDSDDYLPEKTLSILIENIGEFDMISGQIKNTYLSTSFSVVFEGKFNPKIYENNRFNLIKNMTATNYLIRKEFIEKNSLKHSETKRLYADLYFMIPAILHADAVPKINEAIYFKRKRNDPILNPSLNQLDNEILIKSFLEVYLELKSKYSHNIVKKFLDNILLNFYRKRIILAYKSGLNIKSIFDQLCKAINSIEPENLKKYRWPLTSEINAVKNRKVNKYKRIIKRHQFFRNLKRGLESKLKFYIFLYQNFFIKLPVKKDLIFIESFFGRSYSDNPKYIYEYMIENNLAYKYVWSFTEKKDIPGPAKQVKRLSLKYFYYLARSKYWISNSRLPNYLTKPKDNIYLQTWHGTPLKRLAMDMNEVFTANPNNYKKNFYLQTRRWDYLISANEYSSKIFRRAFLFDKDMLEYGYPRNDILYKKNNKKDITSIKQKLNIPLDKEVILYAPTWRDDEYYGRGKYRFTLKLDLDKMKQQLGEEYIIILRMHYFITDVLDLKPYKGFAFDFSKHNDIGELYLISDILITDYSSVFFDYAHLRRPILFYTYDLAKYRDQLRGFYLDIETDVPGPLLKTTDEVIRAIQNIEHISKQYKDKYNEFYERFCQWDDGNATKQIVERVFGK